MILAGGLRVITVRVALGIYSGSVLVVDKSASWRPHEMTSLTRLPQEDVQ